MKDSLKIKIINKIIYICENNVSFRYSQGNKHRYVLSKGLCFSVVNYKELYDELLSIIFIELKLGKNFSSDYIMKFIDNLISDTLKKGIDFVKKNPLSIDIFEDEFQDVVIYIPLDGLNIKVDEIKIGKITLKKIDENEINELSNKFESLIIRNKPFVTKEITDYYLKVIKPILLNFIGKSVAIFKMFASEDVALEEAKKECDMIIDLLRFFAFFFHSKDKTSIGLESEIKRGNYQTIVHKANFYGFKIPNEYKGPIFEFEIDDSTLKSMNEIHVLKLLKILEKSDTNRTDFEKMLLLGIHWFSDSMMQKQIENQFLSLMICLEIFLTPGGERISDFISDATARIYTSGLENRMKVKKKIKEFYGKRSAIVHGRPAKMPNIDDVNLLQVIVADLIIWLTKKSQHFTEKKDLINHIEERQLA